MNLWQLVRQFRYRLRALAWADGAAEKVLAGVIATATPPESVLGTLRNGPLVILSAGEPVGDPAHPGLLTGTMGLTLLVGSSGDKWGQTQLLGGMRGGTASFGQGSSNGRGLLEIEEAVLGNLRMGGGDLGLAVQVAFLNAPAAAKVGDSIVTARDYALRFRCTADRYYHPPQRLVATPGSGQAVLTWALPPDRFDRYKIICRRAAGPTAPATPGAGTEVTLASDLATSVTVSGLSAGAHSFAVFCAYDETWDSMDDSHNAPAEEQRYSSQEVGTTRTATVT